LLSYFCCCFFLKGHKIIYFQNINKIFKIKTIKQTQIKFSFIGQAILDRTLLTIDLLSRGKINIVSVLPARLRTSHISLFNFKFMKIGAKVLLKLDALDQS
jgi:hypothetical protein